MGLWSTRVNARQEERQKRLQRKILNEREEVILIANQVTEGSSAAKHDHTNPNQTTKISPTNDKNQGIMTELSPTTDTIAGATGTTGDQGTRTRRRRGVKEEDSMTAASIGTLGLDAIREDHELKKEEAGDGASENNKDGTARPQVLNSKINVNKGKSFMAMLSTRSLDGD